jgi:hypothetical protein
MPPELFAILMFVVVVIAIALMTWFFRKSRSMLDNWAAENDYTIVSSQRRFFRRGPYLWSTGNQDVYRVTIMTADGSTRSGYVRCGGYWLGVFLSDKVTVEWD